MTGARMTKWLRRHEGCPSGHSFSHSTSLVVRTVFPVTAEHSALHLAMKKSPSLIILAELLAFAFHRSKIGRT